MGIADIKIDGGIIKETLTGIGQFARDLRTAITGKVDPETEAKIQARLAELEAAAQNAQVEVNKVEAAHSSVFVAGWRPMIGWICGISLGVYYIPQALIAACVWAAQCAGVLFAAQYFGAAKIPSYPLIFDVQEILGLVGSLLGLGWLRTAEKKAGVAK